MIRRVSSSFPRETKKATRYPNNNQTMLTREKRLHCSLRSILVLDGLINADWWKHRRLALCLRWRILAWLLRIAWIGRRRRSIAWLGLVVIPSFLLFYFLFYFIIIIFFHCFTLKHLHQKHLQTQTFKVTTPNATNMTFIVYK